MKSLILSLSILSLVSQELTEAFTVPGTREGLTSLTRNGGRSRDACILSESSGNNPVDDFSEERKATLFQFLLRDLQVEGVPLLGCDADQPTTLQAALWTTMAEMSEKDGADKACLIVESIPVDSLRPFVDDFAVLKTQSRLMDCLPELDRFSISLLGKGVGPAIIIETTEKSAELKSKYSDMIGSVPAPDELKYTAAMKTFVSRVVAGQEVCPYTKNHSAGPTGLEDRGVQPGPIVYRVAGYPNVCDVMSAFWSCICEILALPDDQLSATVLCLPAVPSGLDASVAHDRFSVVAELISRFLCLYRGDDVFELLHMHPLYDRDLVHPKDKPAHGHLPPTGWLRAMLRQNGNSEMLTDDELALQNYQRRSPLPAVVIKRVSQLDAGATPENGMVELDLGHGRIEPASGLATYSRNVIKMAGKGKEALQSALDAEIALNE